MSRDLDDGTWPNMDQLNNERIAELEAALARAERYVRAEFMRCLNTMGGLSEVAAKRYEAEPVFQRIKSDVEAVERALAHRVTV